MTIDVSAILKEFGGKIAVNGKIDLPETEFLGEKYRFTEPVTVLGGISNNGESLILRADCKGTILTHCARCMKDIIVPVEFTLDENLVRSEDADSDSEDVIVFDGTCIGIDDIVMNGFLMNLDGKYLCREDCKGLCPDCGADLNEGNCGCDTESIDPRWEGLIDIMKNNE